MPTKSDIYFPPWNRGVPSLRQQLGHGGRDGRQYCASRLGNGPGLVRGSIDVSNLVQTLLTNGNYRIVSGVCSSGDLRDETACEGSSIDTSPARTGSRAKFRGESQRLYRARGTGKGRQGGGCDLQQPDD